MSVQPKIVIYGNEACAYCAAARMLFARKGLAFDDISITSDATRRDEMVRLTEFSHGAG